MSLSDNKAEPVFQKPPERRSRIITLRLTPTQQEILDRLAESLGMGRAELIRTALDYWLAQGAPGSKT